MKNELITEKKSCELSQSPTKAIALAIDEMTEFGIACGLPAEQVKASIRLYAKVLDGLPAKDIEAGVLKVIKGHKYANMPTPGEVYEACSKSKLQQFLEKE